MKIFVDADFRCHVLPLPGCRELETDFFEGRCPAFVEGFRYIPAGESWTREDGKVFHGEMIAPWQDFSWLRGLQEMWEKLQPLVEELQKLVESLQQRVVEDTDPYN